MLTLVKTKKRNVPEWYAEWIKTLGLDTNQELVVRGSFIYDDLTLEQVKVFANPKYTYEQMTEIRNAIKKGLSEEQLAMICDNSLRHTEMEEIVKLCSVYNNGPQTDLRKSNLMTKLALRKLEK